MHYSAASSIVCSCVVMGISISLLFAERSSTDSSMNDNPTNKWQRPGPNSPNPNPDANPNPSLTPRSYDYYFADGDEFHASEILAIASSALNLVVATAL